MSLLLYVVQPVNKNRIKIIIIIFNNINEEKLLDLKITEGVNIFHNDIFVTDAENNIYLNQEDYSVLAKIDDEWIEINEDCFYEIKDRYKEKLSFRPTDESITIEKLTASKLFIKCEGDLNFDWYEFLNWSYVNNKNIDIIFED